MFTLDIIFRERVQFKIIQIQYKLPVSNNKAMSDKLVHLSIRGEKGKNSIIVSSIKFNVRQYSKSGFWALRAITQIY